MAETIRPSPRARMVRKLNVQRVTINILAVLILIARIATTKKATTKKNASAFFGHLGGRTCSTPEVDAGKKAAAQSSTSNVQRRKS